MLTVQSLARNAREPILAELFRSSMRRVAVAILLVALPAGVVIVMEGPALLAGTEPIA